MSLAVGHWIGEYEVGVLVVHDENVIVALRGWDDKLACNVGVDSSGTMTVAGIVVGSHNGHHTHEDSARGFGGSLVSSSKVQMTFPHSLGIRREFTNLPGLKRDRVEKTSVKRLDERTEGG